MIFSLNPRMVPIPAGHFMMGPHPHYGFDAAEVPPQHRVDLVGFLISQTPITQAQWREVANWQPCDGERWHRELDPNPSCFQGERARLLKGETNTDQRPVERVKWHDAMEFCSRLSQRTGRDYTLPSEAQWEYACRAGSTTPFAFGETITPDLANYDSPFTYGSGPKGEHRGQTTPVGSFPANAWSLQDMHGNVYEWCLDHWHRNYEGAPKDGRAWLDPKAGDDTSRVLRGGCWHSLPGTCRSIYRSQNVSTCASDCCGFRVVRNSSDQH